MNFRHLIRAAAAVLLAPGLACSSTNSPSGGSTDCVKNPITPSCKAVDYAKVAADAATAPAVSFKTDIFEPIIRPTCNSSACHGTPLALKNADYPPGGLYLGPSAADSATAEDAALLTLVTTELVQSSKTAPSMKIIAPGDAMSSFLMLKLSGCQNTKSLTCTVQSPDISETMGKGCGDTMPPSCFAQSANAALSDAQIATFARWIAQGAKNN